MAAPAYYPIGVKIPNLVLNENPYGPLLTYFFGTVVVVLLSALLLQRLFAKRALSGFEVFLYVWFFISGLIHAILEGYFALNHATIPGDSALLSQLWKEYAYSDSRYLTSDTFVVVVESFTALFWGPGCLWVAFAILRNYPSRFYVAIIVSMGQLYGDILYYVTAGFEGFPHSNPHWFYFWFYFVFMNAIWIVIPITAIIWASSAISKAIAAQDAASLKAKKN